jgi:hypothetical protein
MERLRPPWTAPQAHSCLLKRAPWMSRLITLLAFCGHFAGLSPAASGAQCFPAFIDPLPRGRNPMQFESLVDLLGHPRHVRFRSLADDLESGEIARFVSRRRLGRGAWATFMLALLLAHGQLEPNGKNCQSEFCMAPLG